MSVHTTRSGAPQHAQLTLTDVGVVRGGQRVLSDVTLSIRHRSRVLAELAQLTAAMADGVDVDDAYARALAPQNARRLGRRTACSPGSRCTRCRCELGHPLTELSVGQRYRVRLACLLGGGDDFVLLDEPTNHLSIALVDELTDALRATRAAVVVSTHDRQLLRDLASWKQLALL